MICVALSLLSTATCSIQLGDEFSLSVGEKYLTAQDGSIVAGQKEDSPFWVGRPNDLGGLNFESDVMNQALNYSPGSHKLVLWRNGSNVTTNKWDVIKRGEKVQLVSLKGTCAALDGTAFKGVKCDPDDRNQLFTVHKKGEEKKVTPTGSGLTYGKCSNHKKSNETFPQAETWGSTE